ncbi:Fic family protein [Tahibacter amnicola]|uniref:Fic family protein n=1 Tax=Tahibacter amnicola TaxID=2976241 RepID=A0ABY6BBU9_9GAMM|nr:Fic family protein [Tahibacter amnicola]UXI66590.1 Fic family protein [Tahibacter amnicola]
MNCGDKTYIWQADDWPHWRYDLNALAGPLSLASKAQGLLLGRLADAGMGLRDLAQLSALTEDAVKTSAIEGEILDVQSVRSSIARRLGVNIGALAPVDRSAEGVVDMIMDATAHYDAPLTEQRLFGWHAALFPTGYSGMSAIRVGRWRDDGNGPMQVVSGPHHRQKVHFQAPPADVLNEEISSFLAWANNDLSHPPLIKAALAHLWFVTLHPFDDGNGRIARAVGDLFLARSDSSPQRFYSLSAQIQRERKDYYDILERTQKRSLEVTPWLMWFLATLQRSIDNAHVTLDSVLRKSRFWQQWAEVPMNARQIKVLNRLLDGFEGRLTSSKWASLAKCSADTALRDINELIGAGVLRKTAGGAARLTKFSSRAKRPASRHLLLHLAKRHIAQRPEVVRHPPTHSWLH